MIRRDFVERMIEEFARVVTRALSLNDERNPDEATRLLQESYVAFFNFRTEMLDRVPPSEMLKQWVLRDKLTLAQMEILASGIRAEADVLMKSDPEKAKCRYVHALAVYEFVDREDLNNYSLARRNAVEEIKYCISAL